MLTNNLISYYCNHLLATTIIYFSLNESMQEISNTFSLDTQEGMRNFLTMVSASEPEITQDYYEILGVKKDATKNEIHKAFRQLAKKYHPDKNKEKGAQDEFIKIFKAYETLSDEKKRKEYDERPNFGSSFNGWQGTNSMNNFDINDFFRQYEDQIFRHAQFHGHTHNQQHYQQHHSHHDGFSFHGVNLDNLFHDIDEDEFSRLFDFAGQHSHHHHNHYGHHEADGTFGDGASYFGTHFPSQLHDTINQYQHHHQNIYSSGRAGYSCHTVTKQVNGMMMTQTSCG